jgi:RimK family alpha-L-glutamate ligase
MANRPRIVLIGNSHSWHVTQLLQRCGRRAVGQVVSWPELAALIGDGKERFLPEAVELADCLLVRGMPAGTLEQVISRMDVLGRLAAQGRRILNQPASLEIAIDKYLSTARLAAAGLPVVPSALVQSAADLDRVRGELGGRLIAKPLFGSNGRGLCQLVEDGEPPEQLRDQGAMLVQQQIPHEGWDVRILVVGDRTYAMKRLAPAGEWRTNIALGGQPAPFVAPADWIELARKAAAAVGAELAGVDLLPAADGTLWILEVNAVPGWQALQRVVSDDLAAAVLELALGTEGNSTNFAEKAGPTAP